MGQGCDGRALVRSPPSLRLFGGRRPCGPGVGWAHISAFSTQSPFIWWEAAAWARVVMGVR